MILNADTKIAAIIKEHPDALEAIIRISPKFEKLRNPLLRKLMAGRTTIGMATKIGGCSTTAFYEQLKPLGFKMDTITIPVAEEKKEVPDFMLNLKKEQIVELDVRPVIASGKDPLSIITEKVKTIKAGAVLKIINIFEPIPLMRLLEKQGFLVYADVIHDNLVETYFFKKSETGETIATPNADVTAGWEDALQHYGDKIKIIDVRQLEMPLPMHTILEDLDTLPNDTALFVYHKRVPVFLLPELAERNFDYRIREISDGEVRLLIFKA